MRELIKTYKQNVPALRFIGKNMTILQMGSARCGKNGLIMAGSI